MTCKIPAVRVEIRAVAKTLRKPRSGAVVLDVHDILLSTGDIAEIQERETRFADMDTMLVPESSRRDNGTTVLLITQWQRLVLAYAPARETRAKAILSVGPLPLSSVQPFDSAQTGSPLATPHQRPSARPRFCMSRSSARSSEIPAEVATLVVTVDIQSAFVKLSKSDLDGLQVWADDVTRLIELAFGSQPDSTASSRDPSLIGSRFFAKTRGSRGSTSDSMSMVSAQRTDSTKETVIKANIGEGMLCRLTFLISVRLQCHSCSDT